MNGFLLSLALALSCLGSDRLMGPNCVHEERRPLRDPWVTVYRSSGIVWLGPGKLVRSTPSYIVVKESLSDAWVVTVFRWNGNAYR